MQHFNLPHLKLLQSRVLIIELTKIHNINEIKVVLYACRSGGLHNPLCFSVLCESGEVNV